MNNSEQIREQKQQYLRVNILDRNYDPNQFMDYCQSSIGSVDIDQWSFNQLVKIVDDFVNSKNVVNKPVITNVNADGANNTGGNQFMNQFSMWGAYIEQMPVKKQQPKFQLNLFDLDFLQGMTSTNNANSNKTTKSNQNINTTSPSLTKAQPNKTTNPNFMSVPADVVKKLQQGNDSFIVAYNPVNIPPQQMQPPQQKVQSIPYRASSPPRQHNSQSPSVASIKPSLMVSQTSSQNFNKNLTCKKLINKSRLQGNQDVVISGHQIINPNVFVPKYVLYFVTVNPNNVEVKRRLKDFQSLRTLLAKFFPTTQIPHLERCSRLSETEPLTIKKQILFLQSFLNSLLSKKQLRCKLLQEFLLCKDLDLLKKIFKEYEKLSGPRALEGLFSPSGELELKMSAQNRKYVNEHIGLNQFMREHFTKVKNLYDTLIQGFEQNTKTILEIEELQKNFKERIKATNNQFTPEYQCPQLQKSIQRVQLMHKQWASSFKTQIRIIQSEIRHLYRYQQDNINTLSLLLKFEQQIGSAYAKRSDKDQANRQQYQSKKLQQFKLSLQNPSKNITVLKHQAAYMQQKLSQECLGYLSEISNKMDNKYKLFCTLQYSICQDMENVWKHFQTYYK